jgi:hypothetical protein
MSRFVVRPVLAAISLAYAAQGADEPLQAHLAPVYQVDDGRLITRNEFGFAKAQSQVKGVAFMAVCTNQWFSGMAPVFQIERTNRFELRRRPLRGQENFTQPLFFGLPLEDETEAPKLAGHWEAVAERDAGRKDFPGFEFAVEADQVAGRFDQDTEYRYAYVSGGTFRSNRLELRIDYMNESWLLAGIWSEGKLKGTWRRADDAEKGAWEATRQEVRLPKGERVALYEWRRESDGERRYRIESPGAEWRRERAVCQVWKVAY